MIATFPAQSPFHVHPFHSRLPSFPHSFDITPLSAATLTLSPKSAFLSKENKTRSGHEVDSEAQYMDEDTNAVGGNIGSHGTVTGLGGSIMPHASFTATSHQPSTQLSPSSSLTQQGKDTHSTTINHPSNTTKENTSRTSSRGKFRKPIYNRSRTASPRMPRIHTSPQDLWQIVGKDDANARKSGGSTLASYVLDGSSPLASPHVELGYARQASVVEVHVGNKYPRIQDEILPRSRTMTPGLDASTSSAPPSPRIAPVPLPSASSRSKSLGHAVPKAIGSERHTRQCQDTELAPKSTRRVGDAEHPVMLLDRGDRVNPDQVLNLLTLPVGSSSKPSSFVLRDSNGSNIRHSKKLSPQVELEPVGLNLRSFASVDSPSENIPLTTLAAAPTVSSTPLPVRVPKPRRTISHESHIEDQRIFLTDPLQQALKYDAIAQFNIQRRRGQQYAPRFASSLNPAREALTEENGLCFTDFAHVDHVHSDEKGRLRSGLHWNYFRVAQRIGGRLRSLCETHNRSACASGTTFSTYLRGGDQKHCLGCRRDGVRVRLLVVGLWKWTARNGAKFDIDYYWPDDSDEEDSDEEVEDEVDARKKDFPMDVDESSDSVLDFGDQATLDSELRKASCEPHSATSPDMEVDVDLQFKLSNEWDGNVPESPRLKDLDDFDDL
ncbi:hypothetical protein Moror_12340 [Moniliophthora roreri MCA 2997]|uniref:Uncharacterized protein n=1 Tax=Moniliophthora roreri (strain MCA 2997) TaxID=1381753 RepID=V2XQ33_MONRO|nr:hypothetical protein Moror_12340 [Moniliophthora roreri MCA 2997]